MPSIEFVHVSDAGTRNVASVSVPRDPKRHTYACTASEYAAYLRANADWWTRSIVSGWCYQPVRGAVRIA